MLVPNDKKAIWRSPIFFFKHVSHIETSAAECHSKCVYFSTAVLNFQSAFSLNLIPGNIFSPSVYIYIYIRRFRELQLIPFLYLSLLYRARI